jgi:hypothetical protein
MPEEMIVRPEDVLPDGVDGAVLNGVQVRKGSVAAFVANARTLQTLETGSPEHDRLAEQLRALAPALEAVGVFEIFDLRSPALKALLAPPPTSPPPTSPPPTSP